MTFFPQGFWLTMADLDENAPAADAGPASAAVSHCLNCNTPLQGEYCHVCGQRDRPVVRFFPTLVLESFENLLAFDSRTWRSLWCLFTRPAFLTREYLAGRRVRYLPPLRLFIVFSLLALFAISLELFLESQGVNLESQGEADIGLDLGDETDTDGSVEDGVTEFLLQLRLPFLSEQTNQQVVDFLQQRAAQNIPAIQEDPGEFIDQMLDQMPFLMLFLIPLLALLQKLAYLFSGRYYVEHLVLTIHNHSFLFFAFALMFVLDLLALTGLAIVVFVTDTLSTLISLWMVIYLFLSLRFMFQQGYFFTTIKFIFISVVYGIVLIAGVLIMGLIGFITF